MGTVWDRATEFLGDNLARVLPVALIGIFLPLSVNDNLAPLAQGAAQQTAITIGLIGVVLALLSIIGQLAVMALALDDDRGTGDAFAVAAVQLWRVIVMSLVVVLFAVVALAPVMIGIAAAGIDMKALFSGDAAAIRTALAGMSSGIAWFVALYSIAWAVLMIWFSARIALAMPVVVAEHVSLAAIARSFKLTYGIVWKILGVMLLYAIVSFVAGLAAKTVFGAILGLIAGGIGPLSLASVLTSIGVGMVGTAFATLQAAFVAKLYVAARARAEEAAGLS